MPPFSGPQDPEDPVQGGDLSPYGPPAPEHGPVMLPAISTLLPNFSLPEGYPFAYGGGVINGPNNGYGYAIGTPAAFGDLPAGNPPAAGNAVIGNAFIDPALTDPNNGGNVGAEAGDGGNAIAAGVDGGDNGDPSLDLAPMLRSLRGTTQCSSCSKQRTNMLRHLATHVTQCNIDGCSQSFAKSAQLGHHLIEIHNHGHLDRCCLGCGGVPSSRRGEVSLHLRQHVVAKNHAGA
ncbi:hypothetical protein F5X99DRAFT_406748 [Biscogniauxia marginata]|nr:hypothetical protein F5X99DRAFT_406748 [Biscogniauxia marginata]